MHIPLHQQDGIESFRISIKTSIDSNNQAVGFKSINFPFVVKEPAGSDKELQFWNKKNPSKGKLKKFLT